MDAGERQHLIEVYKGGLAAVEEALVGITEAELDARSDPTNWTPREVVHHLADSETTSAIRLRRLQAEETPLIDAYDEEEFARRLHYDRPIAADLALFGAVRRASAELLDRLSEEEWGRQGTHSQSGPYGVEDWLRIYAAHGHDHAAQIRQARRRSGDVGTLGDFDSAQNRESGRT